MAKLRVDKIAAPIVKDEFTGSVFFDGTGDYFSVADNGDFDASGDFTIELWANLSLNQTNGWLVGKWNSGSNQREFLINVTSAGKVQFYWSTDGNTHGALNTSDGTISAYEWNHYAWVKNGSVLTGYINGVALASKTDLTSQYNNSSNPLYIGTIDADGSSERIGGYISNLRICKGHAVYTGNFTVPTRELEVHLGAKGVVFPAADNRTVLLSCQSSTDATAEATGRHTITANGDPTAADANPGLFRKTNITSTITETTGSVYFDGTGDYLDIGKSGDFNFLHNGATDWSVEFWAYTGTATRQFVWGTGASSAQTGFYLQIMSASDAQSDATGVFALVGRGAAGNYIGWGADNCLTVNTWHHIAAVFKSSDKTLALYVDGREVDNDSGTVSGTFAAANYSSSNSSYPLIVAKNTHSSTYLTGDISNLRVVAGRRLYTSDFTPPVHALESINGTRILCCNNPDSVTAVSNTDIGKGYTATASGDPTVSTDNPSLTRDFTGGTEFNGVTTFDTQGYFVPPSGTTAERFPDFGAVDAGSARGLFGGGRTPSYLDTIDYITIATTGNAQDFGNLTVARGYMSSSSSRTRGVFNGGATPGALKTQDFITISSTGDALNFGDLQTARYGAGNCSSSTRGLFGGGNPGPSNVIEFITIATAGNTQDFGDLTQARTYVAGCSSSTRGIFGGGTPGVNTIDFVTIPTTGDATDFGDLSQVREGVTGCSNRTRGIFAGGLVSPTLFDTIDFVTIAALGNATDFGDLVAGAYYAAGCSSSIRGVLGGALITPAYQNTIQYVTIASTGNTKDFGDLTATRGVASAVSNGHGGLG